MLYDCHTHTVHSDGQNTTEEMCFSALQNGLSGLTVTDHANMNYYRERNVPENIRASMASIEAQQKKFRGRLKLLKGIELGEYTVCPEKAERILAAEQYDAVLCAVHFVPKAGWSLAYNRIDFQQYMPTADDLNEYLSLYFDLLSETVDAFDFDILAHIHCPVRYMTGKYGRETNLMLFEDQIGRILEKLVKRGIALELNTAAMTDGNGNYNFSLDRIFRAYRAMGGERVTLGSDAHNSLSVGRRFEDAVRLLKECGFDGVCYYENRAPQKILF